MPETRHATTTRFPAAWENIGACPLDKLLLSDLKKELSMRGMSDKD